MSEVDLLPEITVTHEDLAILARVVEDALAEGRYGAAACLGNELHRARIVPAAQVPKDCLGLRATERYLEERSGTVRDVALVTGRSRAAIGTVSVLSNVGTALLGLSEGQRTGWLDAGGRLRVIRLLSVRHAERPSDGRQEGPYLDCIGRRRAQSARGLPVSTGRRVCADCNPTSLPLGMTFVMQAELPVSCVFLQRRTFRPDPIGPCGRPVCLQRAAARSSMSFMSWMTTSRRR